MLVHRLTTRAFALVIIGLAFGACAIGQQYQIQKADYGYGHLRIDVTQRLRELARGNATFRMGTAPSEWIPLRGG
jgi:hypothetical protein